MQISKWKELEYILHKFEIEKNQICIVGSSILSVYGIRENRDIDLVLHPRIRERIVEKYLHEVTILPSGTINFSENVQAAKERYGKIGVTDEKVFDGCYTIIHNGFRMARLELELANKIVRNREKDRNDLQKIGDTYLNIEGFDVQLFERLKDQGRKYTVGL